MVGKHLVGVVQSLVMFFTVSHAQDGGDVYWHLDPAVENCSMVIDPSLTQAEWHTFTKQAGAILSFKSLASARTLGSMQYYIGIDQGRTPVDQRDPAWINTFTHPDETCPLGDAVSFPALRARLGLTDDMDIGGYWTVAPRANYGAAGGEFKYAFLRESGGTPAAAVRAGFTALTGVRDYDFNIYSVEVMASKDFGIVTPYAGIRENLFVGTETTTKVNLVTERVWVPQAYGGVVVSFWMLTLAAEYNVSSLNTLAVAVGFHH